MLPARGASRGCFFLPRPVVFQSMLPARGASSPRDGRVFGYLHFNPCSPRGEHPISGVIFLFAIYFNPCSPRGEHPQVMVKLFVVCVFQSMLPARGASGRARFDRSRGADFNPCSPRGEHQVPVASAQFRVQFQSMLPARGASGVDLGDEGVTAIFQSMLPARGASPASGSKRIWSRNFNPCSPRGEHRIILSAV